MVKGLPTFREHFAGWDDRYVLIGGTAVEAALDEVGLTARATKDLDVVLLVESLDAEFGRVFWDFVLAGGYEHRHHSTGEVCFYRFERPTGESFPSQIELFSRRPDGLELPQNAELTPLPLADEVSSLSAILLDDDYYEFVRNGVVDVAGLPMLVSTHLVPLKARAWLDMTERKAAGMSIDSRDIKKHRTDIVRLYQVISPTARVDLCEAIARDVDAFLKRAFDDGFEPQQAGVKASTAEVVLALRAVYGVGA